VLWLSIWILKLANMLDSCARKTVWNVKIATMFDSCAGVKHLEREASHYV
jgi:hypothetical protein